MKKQIVSIMALLIIYSSHYFAQSIAIGPQASYIKSKDAEKPTIMPGAAVRINLLGLGVEGSVGYKSEEFENGAVKATSYPVMLMEC